MADLQTISIYPPASSASELVNRPDQTFVVKGQAEFLAVAVALGVPILSAHNNAPVNLNLVAAGTGASFSVFASFGEMDLDPMRDLINPSRSAEELLGSAKSGIKLRRFVAKKIVTAQGCDDTRQLAAVINEIRILSDNTIRQCDSIVSMLAVSWSDSPSLGRFWPQVLLEAADEGTLADYLSTVNIDFRTQLAISLDITEALQFLHSRGLVHADLKPANVLVFNNGLGQEQREHWVDSTPVRAKLCDFGYSVIIGDYNSEKRFQARVGSYPWMAPELDAEESILLEDLHKTDIYSFGLLAASIFMNGGLPFEGIEPDEVYSIKSRPKNNPDAAVSTVMQNVRAKASLDQYQEEYIQVLLSGTCVSSQADRVSLAAIQNYLILGILQKLGKGKPAIPTGRYPGLDTAVQTYHDAILAFEKRHTKPEQQGEIDESSEMLEVVCSVRTMALDPTQTFDHDVTLMLENRFQNRSLQPGRIKRFKKGQTTDNELNTQDSFDGYIPDAPDFALERYLTAALMPHVARKEVIEDLRATCDSDLIENPAAPFNLAGAYFNGQIVSPSTEKGLKYLASSAALKSPGAVSVILNIFDACEASLPKEIGQELLATIRTYGTSRFPFVQADFFDYPVSHHVKPSSILANIWTKRWPEDYKKWLSTDRRVFNTAFPFVKRLLRTERKPEQPEFDFDQLMAFQMNGPDKLDPSRRLEFITEVTGLGCLEASGNHGFTLLQVAVVRDDLEMVKLLVLELGASINAYGNTYHWTPLLLACHCGYFTVAKWLVEHGADATVREELNGATILHSLHRFSDRKECEGILEIALSANIDINTPLKNGLTPLHSTFSPWDYSQGAAARLLLKHGADPTRQPGGWDGDSEFSTPIALAVQTLDIHLVQEMISTAESFISVAGASARRQLSRAKAQAFSTLTLRTRFYYMAIAGYGYENKLEDILRLLVDEDMRHVIDELQPENERAADALLASAIHKAQGFFIEALLNVCPDIELNPPCEVLPRNFLHIAIERGGIEAIRCLIRHGASLLAKDMEGRNALQVAAFYFPSVLFELIKLVEELPLEKRGGKSINDILESKDNSGHTVFGRLLLEGHDEERELAETLRVKYCLQHDYKSESDDGSWVTLTGLVVTLATEGRISLGHVPYLLDLSPMPDFICDPDGQTLLTFAVGGFSASRHSYDLPCHQITAMLLRQYPDYDAIFGRSKIQGHTVLHVAAYWSNKTALQMIKDHVQRNYPEKSVPWNLVAEANTVLDWASLSDREKTLRLFDPEENKAATRLTKKATLECYKFLRETGALHNWELHGAIVLARPLIRDVDADVVYLFLHMATEGLGLAPLEKDLNGVIEVADTCSPGATLTRIFIVELAWRYDNFFLKIYFVRVSSLAAEAATQICSWVGQRLTEEGPGLHKFLHLRPGLHPCQTLTYKHPLPNTKEMVEWTRTGRVWTREECDSLVEGFSYLWDVFFGDSEPELVDELTS